MKNQGYGSLRAYASKKSKCLVFLLMGVAFTCWAEWNRGEYADMVGELFFTARSAALSGADLAVSHTGPLLYNPGNLARTGARGLSVTYADLYKSLFSASMLHYTTAVNSNAGVGVSMAYLHIPGIEYTRHLDTEHIVIDDLELFSSSDVWIRVGYGYKLNIGKTDIYYGAAFNARRRRLHKWTGYGIGIDGGVVADHAVGELGALENLYVSAGLMVENITGSYHHWSSYYKEYSLPHLRFSMAFQFDWDVPLPGEVLFAFTSPDLLSNEGINQTGSDEEDDPEQISFRQQPFAIFRNGKIGLEYKVLNTLALRGGLDKGDFSMGAGLSFFDNTVSTDFTYITHQLAGTWKISVTYDWH